MRKILLAAILAITLLLLVQFPRLEVAKGSGEIYIRPDGSVEGTDKIERIGDTFIFNDNINGTVIVERSNIVIDGNGYSLEGIPEIVNNSSGFHLSSASNVTIERTSIMCCSSGILFSNSSHNYVVGNILSHNVIGISNAGSSYSVLRNNTVANNDYGIQLFDVDSNDTFLENVVANNSVGIFLSPASGSILRNNTLIDNECGFLLAQIFVTGAVHYSLIDIDSSNLLDGKPVYYWINEENKTIPADAGWIALIDCTGITIENLTLAKNGQGILLVSTTNSTITHNNIACDTYGLDFMYSSNNTICDNMIANNHLGISQYDSSNNTFFHNNFIDNTDTVLSLGSTNVWDAGYPQGGNYWSGYNVLDSNCDGICDVQYGIDARNNDRYPLAGRLLTCRPDPKYAIEIISNSTLSDLTFNGTAISFYSTCENGTIGFCRISIPKGLMNETYTVLINGTEVGYQPVPSPDGMNNYIYFSYSHSFQNIVVIPELSLTLASILLLINVSLAGTIIRKKKLSR